MCKARNCIEVKLPDWVCTERGQRTAMIDSCIVGVIKRLWFHRINTLGCCCGHGKNYRSVVIGDNENVNEVAKVLGRLDPSNNWVINQWQLNSFVLSEIMEDIRDNEQIRSVGRHRNEDQAMSHRNPCKLFHSG
jgi:hypothetical protein